jgi:hypothetical protein
MTGVKKGAALAAWAATVVAAFAVGRVTAPPESTLVPDDFGAAIRAALSEKDGLDRVQRTASLLQHLNPENVHEAAVVYDRMINILDELDIRPFAIAWARFDPAAALDHILGWPFRDKQKIGAGAVFESWAMRDPAAALQAYQETGTRRSDLSEALFLNMLTGWVYSGQGGIDEYLAGLSNMTQEKGITRVAGKLMRNGGADATIPWVNSIIENDAYENKFKKRVFLRGIRIVGRFDPVRAAAWAMEHEGHGYALDAPRIVAGRWGSRDGPAAMQWVRDHPAVERLGPAVREGFRTWLESDREGAIAWLESETLTAFHDFAILFYAKDLGDRTPEEAIAWCERISDSEQQLRCFNRSAHKWYQRDPVAAETWLQQSPLDEEARSDARLPPKKLRDKMRTRRPGPNP